MILNPMTIASIRILLCITFRCSQSPEGHAFWEYLVNRFYGAFKYKHVTDHELRDFIEHAEERYLAPPIKRNPYYKPILAKEYNRVFRHLNQTRNSYADQPSQTLYYLINRISKRIQFDARLLDLEEYLYVTAFENLYTAGLRDNKQSHYEFCSMVSYA